MSGNRGFVFWLKVISVLDLWIWFTRSLVWYAELPPWPLGGRLMSVPWVRTQWARFVYEGMNGEANGTGNDGDAWKPL